MSQKRIVRFAHDCPYCGAFAGQCFVKKSDGTVVCAHTGRVVK